MITLVFYSLQETVPDIFISTENPATLFPFYVESFHLLHGRTSGAAYQSLNFFYDPTA